MKKKKLQGEQIAIIALVASGVVLAAAGYFFLIAPQSSDKSKLSNQIANVQTEIVVAKSASTKPQPFHASDLFRLARAMPQAVDMPGVILDLDHVARVSGLQLTSVRPSPQVTMALGYSAVPIAITVTGTYSAISRFEEFLRTDVRIAPDTLGVNGRLFDTDNVALVPVTTSTSTSSSGSGQGTSGLGSAGSASPSKTTPPPDTLNATLSIDAFVYGGPPSLTGTAGQGVSASTTATTTTTGAA